MIYSKNIIIKYMKNINSTIIFLLVIIFIVLVIQIFSNIKEGLSGNICDGSTPILLNGTKCVSSCPSGFSVVTYTGNFGRSAKKCKKTCKEKGEAATSKTECCSGLSYVKGYCVDPTEYTGVDAPPVNGAVHSYIGESWKKKGDPSCVTGNSNQAWYCSQKVCKCDNSRSHMQIRNDQFKDDGTSYTFSDGAFRCCH